MVAVGLTLPFAYALAWLLARRRFPGRHRCSMPLVHLPLVLPPVVTGWMLLLLFGRTGPLGRWLEQTFGLVLVFRWTGAALAAAVMALPLMVRAMRLSIEAVDRRLVGAARTLGATPWRAFLTITLPLSLPGRAGRDDARLRPLARRVRRDDHLRLEHPGRNPHAAAGDLHRAAAARRRKRRSTRLAVISVLLSLAALIASELLVRRSHGRTRACPLSIAPDVTASANARVELTIASEARLVGDHRPLGRSARPPCSTASPGCAARWRATSRIAGETLFDARPASTCRPNGAAPAMCSRTSGCSRTARVAANLAYGERSRARPSAG